MTAIGGDGRCMAVCRDCSAEAGTPCTQPFTSLASHDRWVIAHAPGLGHHIRTVAGWWAPQDAYREAFGGQP